MRVAGVQVNGMCAYAFPFGQWGRCSLKHPHQRLGSIEQLHHFLGFALDSNHPRQITFVYYFCKSIEKRAGCTPGFENKPVVRVVQSCSQCSMWTAQDCVSNGSNTDFVCCHAAEA
jgi:hypothetical protein